MTHPIHAFQIHYDEATRRALDPAFLPLDNQANERPDWYEYWPIRRFLLETPLDESAHYGFFSPQFRAKTGLTGAEVLEFASQAADADVITFSPYACHGAVSTNVFEQGNRTFSGFIDAARLFLQDLDPEFRPDVIVNDSRDIVFCNYFVARPKFWRPWMRVVEHAFALAESGTGPVADSLRQPVSYMGKPTQMKIMVLERMASFLLSSGAFTVRNYPPFAIPITPLFSGHEAEVRALDALKMRFRDTGERRCFDEYLLRRDALLRTVTARAG